MSNQYASSQETTSERQDCLHFSGSKRRSIHIRYQSSPLMLTNLSFLNSSSNLSRPNIPTNIKDFARLVDKKERGSTKLKRKASSNMRPSKHPSLFQQYTDRASNFDSNLECLDERDFFCDVPNIEHFDKLNPDASIGIYLKYKKRMVSLSKPFSKSHKSEICLKAIKSHFIGIPL